MANYDEMKGNMQAFYEASKRELEELDKKRAEVVKTLELLTPLFGKNTYTVETLKGAEAAAAASSVSRRGRKATKKVAVAEKKVEEAKKPRVKESTIYDVVFSALGDAYPNSLCANEIIEKLSAKGLPDTTSFKTRIYTLLSEWVDNGKIEKVARGVYKLVKKDDV